MAPRRRPRPGHGRSGRATRSAARGLLGARRAIRRASAGTQFAAEARSEAGRSAGHGGSPCSTDRTGLPGAWRLPAEKPAAPCAVAPPIDFVPCVGIARLRVDLPGPQLRRGRPRPARPPPPSPAGCRRRRPPRRPPRRRRARPPGPEPHLGPGAPGRLGRRPRRLSGRRRRSAACAGWSGTDRPERVFCGDFVVGGGRGSDPRGRPRWASSSTSRPASRGRPAAVLPVELAGGDARTSSTLPGGRIAGPQPPWRSTGRSPPATGDIDRQRLHVTNGELRRVGREAVPEEHLAVVRRLRLLRGLVRRRAPPRAARCAPGTGRGRGGDLRPRHRPRRRCEAGPAPDVVGPARRAVAGRHSERMRFPRSGRRRTKLLLARHLEVVDPGDRAAGEDVAAAQGARRLPAPGRDHHVRHRDLVDGSDPVRTAGAVDRCA